MSDDPQLVTSLQSLLSQARNRAENPARTLALAQAFASLDDALQARMPRQLRGHCRVAVVEDDVLVLLADSSAWATRVRLQAAELLAIARSLWPAPLKDLKVLVRNHPGARRRARP